MTHTNALIKGTGLHEPNRDKGGFFALWVLSRDRCYLLWMVKTMKKPTHNAARTVNSSRNGVSARNNQIARSSRPKPASHYFLTILSAAYLLAVVWTSLAYAAESRTKAIPIAVLAPMASLRTTPIPGRRLDVRAYVQNAAKATGVNPRDAEWIVSHESAHRPQATGDGGESRGLWQINRLYHPEVSDQCAYDVECSTDWSLQRIRDGNINEWSTWKYRSRWLPKSPE